MPEFSSYTYGTIYAFFSEVNVTIRYAEFNFIAGWSTKMMAVQEL
jgi:hypothetical protein